MSQRVGMQFCRDSVRPHQRLNGATYGDGRAPRSKWGIVAGSDPEGETGEGGQARARRDILLVSGAYGSLLLLNQMFRILSTGLRFQGETILPLPWTNSGLLLGSVGGGLLGPGEVALVGLSVLLISVFAWRVLAYSRRGPSFSIPVSLVDTLLLGSAIVLVWVIAVCVLQPFWIEYQSLNVLKGTPLTNLFVLQASILSTAALGLTKATTLAGPQRNTVVFVSVLVMAVLLIAVPPLLSSTLGEYGMIRGGW